MKKKVVYHIGSLAGWPYALAKGFRAQGYDSVNVILNTVDADGTTNKIGKSNRQLKYDLYLFEKNPNAIVKLFLRLKLFVKMLNEAAVVHYHGSTLLPKHLDALFFKWFGIPTVMSWGGGDARLIGVASAQNPYFFRYGEKERDASIRKFLFKLKKYGVTIATDPEMAMYMEGIFDPVYTFRQPLDVSELNCIFPSMENKKPIFLHIPTHPFVKGTVHIENAFKKLQKEGLSFTPELIDSSLTQSEVRKKISECDVYVDELRCGAYGYTALEAAGSGKPTMTFILDKVAAQLPPELPFVNTNPDTIYDNLKMLISNPEMREKIGKQSRLYVENHHDVKVVVKDMLKLYRQLGAKI
jgi:glycosyltransferase involved in cell wall biosynthesis